MALMMLAESCTTAPPRLIATSGASSGWMTSRACGWRSATSASARLRPRHRNTDTPAPHEQAAATVYRARMPKSRRDRKWERDRRLLMAAGSMTGFGVSVNAGLSGAIRWSRRDTEGAERVGFCSAISAPLRFQSGRSAGGLPAHSEREVHRFLAALAFQVVILAELENGPALRAPGWQVQRQVNPPGWVADLDRLATSLRAGRLRQRGRVLKWFVLHRAVEVRAGRPLNLELERSQFDRAGILDLEADPATTTATAACPLSVVSRVEVEGWRGGGRRRRRCVGGRRRGGRRGRGGVGWREGRRRRSIRSLWDSGAVAGGRRVAGRDPTSVL